ncbi:MAG: nuclear transport factor 2 family protein [bacterium]|jgi:3-phenylpropionate/cinnamic acid dioxygenase small subunit|nr:Ring hydroxylating enzyme beta subunit [Deltaproteobacteria bacterium]MCP4244460.1 nuclear transport factor 2 family protein [bacterium]MDP6073928.1 nuclear transport factor 2 family protein [Myxococcota bacterium]MDP7298316.1 nuclear transport factor 2 family protein [Myxococcota bacterium]HJO23832.1 nuclear transport factor 2 family protein [Myxococcota bacterium]|tara:strand:+ start:581 stop:1084 length:504 start_codon:yes stop_codon:yes gene_type:complete
MGAGTWESHHAITTLMYRYAECVDTADFDGLSDLFAQGSIRSPSAAEPGEGMTGASVGRFYAATNRVHEDGTLRTRHVSTNVIVDIDEEADAATVRSYYVVFQATGKLPFQAIVGGRYQDRFARINGKWHFAERVIHVDQIGDMSEHLNFDLAKGAIRYKDVVPPQS